MDETGKSAQKVTAKSAHELLAERESSPKGRPTAHLILRFWNSPKRELYHAEFLAAGSRKKSYIKRRDPSFRFSWSRTSQAISVLFLEYVVAGLENRADDFSFPGSQRKSLAATIADAMAKDGYLTELFKTYPPEGGVIPIPEEVIDGLNLGGTENNERRILIKSAYLPPERVEIYLDGRRITDARELRTLNEELRKTNKLEPSRQPPAPAKPKTEETPNAQATEQTSAPKPGGNAGQAQDKPKGEWQADYQDLLRDIFIKPKGAEQPAAADPDPDFEIEAPPLTIDPEVYEIRNPIGSQWPDSKPLINFGKRDSTADVWTIRDASEGVLIFGSVGSGKTSGSGSAISTALLSNGYGGLVLTAKPDEAHRWLRLCERTGRMDDCVHVTPRSGHKLNILQYEAQRPGERFAVVEGMIDLFRTIVNTMSNSPEGKNKDDFWTHSTDEMVRNILEFFLMAGEPITIRNIVRFIRKAPLQPDPNWRKILYFGEVIARAENFAKEGSNQDRQVFMDAFDYWRHEFPIIPDVTRGGIVSGFTAMAGVLKGRDIYDCIGTETNLTPEMILAGKIVILDFPTKGNVKGGLMVQAAWKLLCQQAIERRADKGRADARPVFLWEDEGQEFFSQHDPRFQPTARDCRACHVIISQNLPNFYRLGHSDSSVQAVFSAMNTHIFHTNGDERTNKWASDSIGMINKRRMRASGGIVGPLFPKKSDKRESVGGNFEIEDKLELAIRPEQFGHLKKGGPPDGKCEAVIHWLSHKFECNHNYQYCVRTFDQEPRVSQTPT